MTTIGYSATASAICWVPSSDRRVVLSRVSAAGTRGVSASTVIPLPQKPIGTSWDVSFDVSAQIAAGDSVASVAVALSSPAGLSVIYSGGWGNLAVLWLASGGSPGQTYALDLLVKTAQGRQLAYVATVAVPTPGQGASPAQITVVQVPTSYVDAAVAVAEAAAAAAQATAAACLPKAGGTVTGPVMMDGGFLANGKTISGSGSVPANTNAVLLGPVSIAASATVTVSSNGSLRII
jgi:hypothetical protein